MTIAALSSFLLTTAACITLHRRRRFRRNPKPRILLASRVHASSSSELPKPSVLDTFTHSIRSLSPFNVSGVVAVDDLIAPVLSASDVETLVVTPWGRFTPALNAIVSYAVRNQFDVLTLVSAEVEVKAEDLRRLLAELSDDTLVVGKRLPGHNYDEGCNELTGRTTPWNTLALWNVRKLALTGFSLVSEGDLDGVDGGVEEVVCIATLQSLLGQSRARAKVVDCGAGGGGWDTAFSDEGRRAWHEKKMKSKEERPRKQMEEVGLAGGIVEHL